MNKHKEYQIAYKNGSYQLVYGDNLRDALLRPRLYLADSAIESVNGRTLAEWESMQIQWDEIREERGWGKDGKPDRSRPKPSVVIAPEIPLDQRPDFVAGYNLGGSNVWKRACKMVGMAMKARDESRVLDAAKIDALTRALEEISALSDTWQAVGRDRPPYWNLGDIANSALKKAGK